MKKIIISFILSFLAFIAEAQDPMLYSGDCKIALNTNKVIAPVKLWKIDSLRTQYVYKGNLTEILTSDISKIITLNYELTFASTPFRQNIRFYDQIIAEDGDTIRGFIKDIGLRVIKYLPPDGKKIKYSYFKSYILNNKTDNMNSSTKEETPTLSYQTISDTGVSTLQTLSSDTSEWSKIYFTETKDRYLNNDLIVKTNGEIIWCTIIRITNSDIYCHIARYGNDPDLKISKSEIKKVYNNADGKFENYDGIKSKLYSSSNNSTYLKNTDRIYTLNGDSIICTILSINEFEIYYHIMVDGKDPKIKIPANEVKSYKMEQNLSNEGSKKDPKKPSSGQKGKIVFLIISGLLAISFIQGL